MGWLIGPTLAAAMLSALALYVYDRVIVASAHGLFSSITRAGLSIGVGASVLMVALLRRFDDSTRRFMSGSKEVGKAAKSLYKIKRFW